MKVANFVQNIIKTKLSDGCGLISNIYLSPKRDSEYPYCIINVKDIKDASDLRETAFVCLTYIDIYDKNIDNVGIINISEEIKDNLNGILDNQNNDFAVRRVVFERGDLKLFNELNLVWKITLEFKIFVKALD
jgi:hypothetical protein